MTKLLHDAPCSVLVAGSAGEGDEFPRSVVVGYDGSEQAATAVRIAVEVARRAGASLDALCARGSKEMDVEALQASLTAIAPGVSLSVEHHDPVDALVSAGADLVVVGNRGLHGMKTLGSVSERVAHKADCSVLVVR
jgi:nucleotide-binding universal stress UspA family protein